MRSYEFIGKTVEKAIKEGLETLGKSQEDVDIEIVSNGGFFKKAKVIIKIQDDFEVKPATKENQVQEQKLQPKDSQSVEQKIEEEQPKAESKDQEIKEEKTEEISPKIEEKEQKTEQKQEKLEKKEENSSKKNNKKTVEYVIPTEEELAEKRRRFAEKHFENNQTSVEFVEGLLKVLKIDGNVTLEETKEASEILIETEDAGRVIGYRGDSISAIQYLANIIESNKNPHAKRVVVDSGDYKQKREQSLRALAIRTAGKVSETGRTYKLEPMTAYERRIIHTELQNYPSVETHSEGVEPFRRIVVTKKR